MSADFEKLEVWQKSMDFADDLFSITEEVSKSKKHFRVIEQLESAGLSIPQNIAEGKGRYSKKEFVQFLFYARGSLNEALTVAIFFHRRKLISDEVMTNIRNQSTEIGKMLNALINAIRASMK